MTIPTGYELLKPIRRRVGAVSIYPEFRAVQVNADAYRQLGEPDRLDAAWDGRGTLVLIPNASGRFSVKKSRTQIVFSRDEWVRFGITATSRYYAGYEVTDGRMFVRLHEEV